jgi:hypothetical protein
MAGYLLLQCRHTRPALVRCCTSQNRDVDDGDDKSNDLSLRSCALDGPAPSFSPAPKRSPPHTSSSNNNNNTHLRSSIPSTFFTFSARDTASPPVTLPVLKWNKSDRCATFVELVARHLFLSDLFRLFEGFLLSFWFALAQHTICSFAFVRASKY